MDKEGGFSLLYEDTFGNQTIESATSKGKRAIISEIRTQNMYPQFFYGEKIAESVVKLYGSESDQSVVLFFDDKDFLGKI